MAIQIRCSNPRCGAETYAENTTCLLRDHVAETTPYSGLFRCSQCGKATGYVEKHFELQETEEGGKKESWNPILRGVVKINDPLKASGSRAEEGPPSKMEFSYQPFLYLISYRPDGPIEDFWFSYYKDTRNEPGGKLKLGHGPGGPPVLSREGLLGVVKQLALLGSVSRKNLEGVLTVFEEA